MAAEAQGYIEIAADPENSWNWFKNVNIVVAMVKVKSYRRYQGQDG